MSNEKRISNITNDHAINRRDALGGLATVTAVAAVRKWRLLKSALSVIKHSRADIAVVRAARQYLLVIDCSF